MVDFRAQGDDLAIDLNELEVQMLLSLTRQMVDFVGPTDRAGDDPLVAMIGIDPDAAPSDDPALLRLLPDAFMDDDEAAAEFRRFTERELRDGKVRNALAVRSDLEAGHVVVSRESMRAWLGFLNDARLVLGARLDLTEDNQDDFASLPDDDPRAALFGLYGWLTYVQEELVQHAMGRPW
jgi:hypothetical protein